MVWVFQKNDEVFTYKLDNLIKLKLYPDNRPHNLETSQLEKGIVLDFNEVEIIGEGMGYGVPVIKYRDKTFFSGTSTCDLNENSPNIITKTFILDMISRKYYKSSQISDIIYRPLHKIFTLFYLRLKPLRFFFDKIMEVRKNFGIYTMFVKTKPRGKIKFDYHVRDKEIAINADFSELDLRDCDEIIILNEQGAFFFNIYSDSNGIMLCKDQIGAWEKVDSDFSFFSDSNSKLSFMLKPFPNMSLFRGWEKMSSRLSWAGLNYCLKPNREFFSYSIKIIDGTP
jgi:hypothetical protein